MGFERLSNVWPQWKVVEPLGEGSYGKVYKAAREEHGFTDYAAIKVISVPQSDAEIISRRSEGYNEASIRTYFKDIVDDFVKEIELMASVKGTANIVSIEDYAVVEKADGIGWDIFIRMELLTSFISHLADKRLGEDEVVKLGQDVCSALERCAKKNIIHRDIKPENIFVSSFGDFKVGDFGVAREQTGTVGVMSSIGSPPYIAPEVEKGKKYDGTADIYSLGIVLYKLLNNNRLPFIDPYSEQIFYKESKEAIDRRMSGETLPAPVGASPQMAQVVLKACEFDPAKRFKTAAEFKAALEAVKKGTYEIEPQSTSEKQPKSTLEPEPGNLGGTVRLFPNPAPPIPQSPESEVPIAPKPSEPKLVCKHCGGGNKEGYNYCIHCGKPSPIKKKPIADVFVVAAVCVIGFVALVFALVDGGETTPTPTPPPETPTPEPPPPPTTPESIYITYNGAHATEISVYVGEYITVSSKVSPIEADAEIAWSSSETDVFTVVADPSGKSAGIVGQSPGIAVLTASADGVVQTCDVRVDISHEHMGDYVNDYDKSVSFTITWHDGRGNGRTIFRRASGSQEWRVDSHNGDSWKVNPNFTYENRDEGYAFAIRFPTTDNIYFLFRDGEGYHFTPRNASKSGVTWDFEWW